MTAHPEAAPTSLAKPAPTPRMLFQRHRRALRARRIVRLQFVYCAFSGVRFVTLCAVPSDLGRSALEISEHLRQRLLRAFLHWMSSSQPHWTDGPDAGGVFAWDLEDDVFTHRHCGYTQQFFRQTTVG